MLVLVRAAPIVQAVVQSLIEPARGSAPAHLGLGNFAFLVQYAPFADSVVVTIQFVVISVTAQMVAALLLALLLSGRMRGAGSMRTVLLLPLAIPVAAATTVWGMILRPEGLLNGLLAVVGIDQQPLLTDGSQALSAVALILLWTACGYWMTIIIAGIHDIPGDLHEAASLDGAGRRAKFWHIDLPMLRRPLLFVAVACTVSNFMAFAPAQILTKGGPEGSTRLIMYEIYTQAFTNLDPGLSSAQIVVTMVILGLVVAAQFRLLTEEASS